MLEMNDIVLYFYGSVYPKAPSTCRYAVVTSYSRA